MKKIIHLLIVICFLLSIIGCINQKDEYVWEDVEATTTV